MRLSSLLLLVVFLVGLLIFRYLKPTPSIKNTVLMDTVAISRPREEFVASDSLVNLRVQHLKNPKKAEKFYKNYEKELRALIRYNEEKVIAPLRLQLQRQKQFVKVSQI